MGTFKGVDKIYVQVIVDVFRWLAFAKVYTANMPVAAADLLCDRALSFYDALGLKIGAILTNTGREYCGQLEQHPFELLLAMKDFEHCTTNARSPCTDGFVDRINRTSPDDCFRVKCRQTWYMGVDEIQRDLDRFTILRPRAQPPGPTAQGPYCGSDPDESTRRRGDFLNHPPPMRASSRCHRPRRRHPREQGVGEMRDLCTPPSLPSAVKPRVGDRRTCLAYDFLRALHLPFLPCQRFQPLTLRPRQPGRSAVVAFGPPHPLAQRLRRTAAIRHVRLHRRPRQAVFVLLLDHHAYRAPPNFR